MHAITESGAPSGDKHVLLWNPPVVNPDLGLRASARSQSNRIARIAIKAGLKTLVFAQSRLDGRGADQVPQGRVRPRPAQAGAHPRLSRRLPADRAARGRARDARGPHRRHRRRPRRWSWASTSAPRRRACSTAIRARSRRRGSASAAPAGGSSRRWACWSPARDPLDQYVVRHPEFFSGATPEHARIAPTSR